jgi:hypothetical protein
MPRRPPWIRIRNRRRMLVAYTALVGVLTVAFAAFYGRSHDVRANAERQRTAPSYSSAVSAAISWTRAPSSAEMPDSTLTPGAVATANTATVCRPGYATSVRPTGLIWKRLKEQAYVEYGIRRGHRSYVDNHGVRHPAYEIDHLIPLEIGGAPADIRNLWPEPIESARVKDEVENELHELVCSGRMSITRAQSAIANDWKTAVPGQNIH